MLGADGAKWRVGASRVYSWCFDCECGVLVARLDSCKIINSMRRRELEPQSVDLLKRPFAGLPPLAAFSFPSCNF